MLASPTRCARRGESGDGQAGRGQAAGACRGRRSSSCLLPRRDGGAWARRARCLDRHRGGDGIRRVVVVAASYLAQVRVCGFGGEDRWEGVEVLAEGLQLPFAAVHPGASDLAGERAVAEASLLSRGVPGGLALVLARWMGWRISTLSRLSRSIFLTSEDEILTALNKQLCNYVTPRRRKAVAKLYAGEAGAANIRCWMVTGGRSGDEGSAEQNDAVFPIPTVVRVEFDSYLEHHWKRLGLGPDDPLLPGENLRQGVSTNTPNDWWHKAEVALATRDRILGVSPGNAWHGFRITRRTEYRSVHDRYGGRLVGHSVHTGTPALPFRRAATSASFPRIS